MGSDTALPNRPRCALFLLTCPLRLNDVPVVLRTRVWPEEIGSDMAHTKGSGDGGAQEGIDRPSGDLSGRRALCAFFSHGRICSCLVYAQAKIQWNAPEFMPTDAAPYISLSLFCLALRQGQVKLVNTRHGGRINLRRSEWGHVVYENL